MAKELRLRVDGSNYIAWRKTAKITLSQRGLLSLVKRPAESKSEETKYDSDGDEIYQNDANEALVVRYLHEPCTAQVIAAHLSGVVPTPQVYWTTINRVFKVQGKKRGMLALQHITNLQWQSEWSGSQFVQHFNEAARQLRESAPEQSNNDFLCQLFLSKSVVKQRVWAETRMAAWDDDKKLLIENLTNEIAAMDKDPIFQSQTAMLAATASPANGRKAKPRVQCK